MFYLLLFIRIFFFFSRFEANQTRKSKSQRMRRSGKSAKCLSYLFVWYIHSLLLESHHSLGLCFFFLGSCGVYIPIWFLENKTKWKRKMWGKKIRIYQTALSSIWKISFDARCAMHILRIVSLVHFSMRTPNTDSHVHSSTTSKSMRKSTILEQIMHCNNSDEKTQLLVHILEF